MFAKSSKHLNLASSPILFFSVWVFGHTFEIWSVLQLCCTSQAVLSFHRLCECCMVETCWTSYPLNTRDRYSKYQGEGRGPTLRAPRLSLAYMFLLFSSYFSPKKLKWTNLKVFFPCFSWELKSRRAQEHVLMSHSYILTVCLVSCVFEFQWRQVELLVIHTAPSQSLLAVLVSASTSARWCSTLSN